MKKKPGMRIAFYAPMKSPDHPRPSGDRRMAQMLMRALSHGGHEVFLASRFRTYDGKGNQERQERLKALGEKVARRLIKAWRAKPAEERPQIWFTYHLYHKAPDHIGPAVAGALGIPYVVAEASVAPKRADGPWALGYDVALKALRTAAMVITLNPGDSLCLPQSQVQRGLKPFIDTAPFQASTAQRANERRLWAERFGLDERKPWLLTLAMMRAGDKLESYRVLASALRGLPDLPWQLLIAGDGPVRGEVEAAFRAFTGGSAKRVAFLGEVKMENVPSLCIAADLSVWPAVGEAYGMALLESQAAAMPVIAGRSEGVAAIVRDGQTGILTKVGDSSAFAAAIRALLSAPALRRQMSVAAAEEMAREHSLDAASERLNAILAEVS